MSFFQVFSAQTTALTSGDNFSDPWTVTSPRYWGSLAYTKGTETGIRIHLQLETATDTWVDVTDQDEDAADVLSDAQITASSDLCCEISSGWRAVERTAALPRGVRARLRIDCAGGGGPNTDVVIQVCAVGFGSH